MEKDRCVICNGTYPFYSDDGLCGACRKHLSKIVPLIVNRSKRVTLVLFCNGEFKVRPSSVDEVF